jgi:hypothetical protein
VKGDDDVEVEETADNKETLSSLLQRICTNWQIASIHGFFVAPLESPKTNVWQDLKYVKVLALLSEVTKGHVV